MIDETTLLPDSRFDFDNYSPRRTFKPSLKGFIGAIGAVVGAGLFFANVNHREDVGYVNGISHQSETLTISDAPSIEIREARKLQPRHYSISFEQIADDGYIIHPDAVRSGMFSFPQPISLGNRVRVEVKDYPIIGEFARVAQIYN